MQKQKFDLQPKISDLQKLAEDYWTEMGESWRENEKAAFDADLSIRNGEY